MTTTNKNINDMTFIRHLIRDHINDNGRTLYWLSEKMGISAPYMSQLLNGARNMSTLHLLRITQILNVRIDIGIDAPRMR